MGVNVGYGFGLVFKEIAVRLRRNTSSVTFVDEPHRGVTWIQQTLTIEVRPGLFWLWHANSALLLLINVSTVRRVKNKALSLQYWNSGARFLGRGSEQF